MRAIKALFALVIVITLCTACSISMEPKPTQTTDATTTAAPATDATETAAVTTEAPTEGRSAPPAQDDLLNFALIDRLFSMTYADFCQEEGKTVEPEGIYDGGVYCYFSKYGDSTPFFFDADGDAENPKVNDPEHNLLNMASFKASALLINKQSITLGDLKRWLSAKGIECTARYSEYSDSIRFFFEWEKYEIMGDLDSEKDSAPVKYFEIYCKSNYN